MLARRIEKALEQAREQARHHWARELDPLLSLVHGWLVREALLEPLPATEASRLQAEVDHHPLWLFPEEKPTPAESDLSRFGTRITAISDPALHAVCLPVMWSYLQDAELLFGRPHCRARFLVYAGNLLHVEEEERLLSLLEGHSTVVPDDWLSFIESLDNAGTWSAVGAGPPTAER